MEQHDRVAAHIEKERVRRADPRSAQELIEIALIEDDEHAEWEPVSIMAYRASREDFEAARALCQSGDAKQRQLGANILSQLGIPKRAYPQEAIPILSKMLLDESDPETLHAIIVALGYQGDPQIVPIIARSKTHHDADIRYSVAFSLGGYDDDTAIETLIDLSNDPVANVRDWATCGLGTLSKRDTNAIRDALLARVRDEDQETRAEALKGLAFRGDARILNPLIEALSSLDGVPNYIVAMLFEAVKAMADPRLLPVMEALHEGWNDYEEYEIAIVRCMRKTTNENHDS